MSYSTHQISRFGSFLLVAFVAVAIFIKVLPVPVMLGNGLNACLGIASLLYVFATEKHSVIPTIVLLYCLAASTLMAICMVYSQNISPEDLLWIITYAGPVAILLTKKVSYKATQVLFWITAFFYCVCAVLGIDPSTISETGSRNGVSANIIFVAVLLYLLQWNQTGKISLLPAIATFLICVYGQGRTGVLVGGLLLVFVGLYYLFRVKGLRLSRVVLILFLATVVGYLLSTYFADYLVSMNSRFDREGLDTSRYDMWQTYLNLLWQNVGNFLLGAPVSDSWLLQQHGGNLHNSFFILHSHFGLVGVVAIVLMLLMYCNYSLRNGKLFEFGLLIILIARALFDATAFAGLYDIYFVTILLGVLLIRDKNLLAQGSFFSYSLQKQKIAKA